jgi:hypothetical protein
MCATKWRLGLILIVLMTMAWSTACTSLQVLPLGEAPPQTSSMRVGERVRVTTKGGEKQHFKVTAIEADALVGGKARVRYDDIAVLEVRQPDKAKTTILVVAATIGGILVIAGAVEAAGAVAGLEAL